MKNIDKAKPVLVTGATGYVASWLVKKLLEEGINVHAAVRDPGNKTKLEHLNAIAADAPGNIQYFKSDLLEDGSYDEAMNSFIKPNLTINIDYKLNEILEKLLNIN